MRIIIDHKTIKRKARIGQILGVAGLLVLAGGLYVSWNRPELGLFWLGTFFVGFALSQIGIYYGNRYARPPRPDQSVDKALKGLDNRHTIFHYETPVTHLLVGPSGIWAIFPHFQRGRIVYQKGRWRQKSKNIADALWMGYLAIFAQEGLGRPDLEIAGEISGLKQHLQKHLPEGKTLPPIHAALVFTDSRAVIDASEAPVPTVMAEDLKDLVRKNAKQNKIDQEMIDFVLGLFDKGQEITEE